MSPEWPAILVLGAVAAGLTGSALAPATDADSLNYHLGVPLDWLRNGGAYPRQDWLHARLVGLGESANLLGLAAGTDNLGAGLQLAGLALSCLAVGGLGRTREEKLFAVLLVASCPAMLFLVPNQKPQLLPAAALTLALVGLVRGPGPPSRATIAAGLGCVGFAIGCKYSFLLSGAVLLLTILIVARRNGQLRFAIAAAGVAMAAFAAPLYARNALFYGDPLSPFLERLFSGPDAVVVAFADQLRRFGGARDIETLLALPMTLVVPTGPGRLASVLGVGVLGVALLGGRGAAVTTIRRASLVCAALILAFSQLTPRFFLEPFLWMGVGVSVCAPGVAKRTLKNALIAQGSIVAVAALFGAVTLFPGSLSLKLRDRVMEKSAYQYAQSRWLDEILPEQAVVLTNLRSKALLPRVFVGTDTLVSMPPEEFARAILRFADRHDISAIAFNQGRRPDTRLDGVLQLREFGYERSEEFVAATRNPFNRNWREMLHVLVARGGESSNTGERDEQESQRGAGQARQATR